MLNQPDSVPSLPDARHFAVRFRMKITLLIPVALLAVAWVFGPAALPLPWLLGGLACAALGMALRMWAAGCLRKSEQVICSGPFAYVRNPLYIGTFFLGCGFCCLTGRWVTFPLLLAGMLAVYLPTAKYEEQQLLTLFGEAYRQYRAAVPPWFPRLSRCRELPAGEPFRWSLLLHNREHRHLVAQVAFLLAFWAVYAVKA